MTLWSKEPKSLPAIFFRLNLRTHHLSHLDLSRPDDGQKKDHDARVIQRADIAALRYGAVKGQKVLYFWDKAIVDYPTWSRLKMRGIYFATREKSNSALRQMGIDQLDRRDPRNEGVQSDILVGGSNGEALRRIIYQDPQDHKVCTYLTNEMQLPAWVIVLGYRHRWDVEKIFDQLKNKMAEQKSWASGEVAKEVHGVFECLVHNLALLFEEEIKVNEGLDDQREKRIDRGRSPYRTNREQEKLQAATNFINNAITRATQRTVRFLRWLTAWLYHQAPWHEAMGRLAKLWAPNF